MEHVYYHALTYNRSGSNMWRDAELPTEILNKTAKLRNLDGPVWSSNPLSLSLGGITYALTDYGELCALDFKGREGSQCCSISFSLFTVAKNLNFL